MARSSGRQAAVHCSGGTLLIPRHGTALHLLRDCPALRLPRSREVSMRSSRRSRALRTVFSHRRLSHRSARHIRRRGGNAAAPVPAAVDNGRAQAGSAAGAWPLVPGCGSAGESAAGSAWLCALRTLRGGVQFLAGLRVHRRRARLAGHPGGVGKDGPRAHGSAEIMVCHDGSPWPSSRAWSRAS